MASAFRVLLLLCFVSACWALEQCKEVNKKVILKEGEFGLIKGEPVKIYTWTNANGMEVEVINYGGRIRSIKVPDKKGNIADVVLGYDKIEDYVKDNTYFGAILGRTANRIVGASYTLDGKKYKLTANQKGDSFHGGTGGFSHVLWEPHVHGTALTLSYYSPDGQDGYGGAVVVQVTYELTEDNVLIFKVRAATTKPTPITIGNHAYYNLAGHDAGPEGTFQHTVRINADKFLKYNADGQPTGEIEEVKDICYDFRNEVSLGKMILECGSYDNYYCLDRKTIGHIVYVGEIQHGESGRKLEVHSNQPGVVWYTAKNLSKDYTVIGKGGVEYHQNGSMCMETHGYPDAINHPNFPSVVLYPGEVYEHITYYKFSIIHTKEQH